MNKGTSLPNQWPSYGGSYDEQRFSPLTAINDGNVAQLGLAWYADYDSNQNQHGSPLYADGVIYEHNDTLAAIMPESGPPASGAPLSR